MGGFMYGVCLPCGAAVVHEYFVRSEIIGIANLTKERADPRLVAEIEECLKNPDLKALCDSYDEPVPSIDKIRIEYRCMDREQAFSRAVLARVKFYDVPLNISEETLLQCTPCVPPPWSQHVNEQLYIEDDGVWFDVEYRVHWDCFDEDGRINDLRKFTDDKEMALEQFKVLNALAPSVFGLNGWWRKNN